jgi:hypothetical protein
MMSVSLARGDQWVIKEEILTPRWGLSVSAVNGRVYAIGGIDDNNVMSSAAEEYDPLSGRWIKKTEMPTERYGLSTGAVNAIML